MRYILIFSYCGKNYHGFQFQKHQPTIQHELELALEKVTHSPIKIHASGRTDKGVSALKHVAHFDYDKNIANFKRRLNIVLPHDIKVLKVEVVDSTFHARYMAKTKTYKYTFYTSKPNIPYLDQFAYHVKGTLNVSAMKKAMKQFKGEHDFTSFCMAEVDIQDKTRTILKTKLHVTKTCGVELYTFTITGSGFLYKMVRIIIGTIIDVGRGKINVHDIEKIFAAKNRKAASKTVPAHPLLLVDVTY